jgi:predicted metal-dependent phosphoesterase TrpH
VTAGGSVDLHAHSTASDGVLSPQELVARAARLGVSTLALTDHDTLDGLPAAQAAARLEGVRLVPGVELSVRVAHGSMHLLGYLPSAAPQPLAGRIGAIAAAREDRNRRMVERLAELGAPVEWEAVAAHATGRVGRPHIARALVAAGHAADVGDAFERYLAAGAPAYLEAGSLSPSEAVELVRASGGAPVLAHPGTLRLDPAALAELVAALAAAGLAGVEVVRPDHDEARRGELAALCARHGIIATGGSDFHRPDGQVELGRLGAPLDPGVCDRLLA